MTELLGKIFDRKYRLTRMIGEGGMGSVYEAEHTLIQRKVAVKVMHNEFSTMPEVVERFFREAQASSAIGHPNIIEVFDVGIEEDGTVFIVMELLTGEPLLDRLRYGETLPSETAVSTILQVLSGLVVAHHKGIIHRDLKPDNVFLCIDARGRHEVKLLDFGIAKVQGALDGDQGLTKTGTVLGTPNYMSPEQARGREVDHRIDIWAAGVMLYQMLSGRLPYKGESYNEVLSSILLDDPPRLSEVAPTVPRGLATVVERAMEKDRNDRYASVAEMIEDLIPYNDKAAQELMTDTAATALKNSLIPPAPVSQQDTLLATHEQFVASAGSRRGIATPRVDELIMGMGKATFSDKEPGVTTGRVEAPPAPSNTADLGDLEGVDPRGHIPYPPRKSYGGLKKTLLVLLLVIGVGVGYIYLKKRADQTFVQSGEAVYDQAVAMWHGTVEELPPAPALSDFTAGIADEGETDRPESTDGTPDAGAAEDSDATKVVEEPPLPERVTIKLTGVPKRGKVTLDGKNVSSPLKLPGGSEPLLLKVTSRRYKTFELEIVPDRDQTVELKLGHKGQNKRVPRKGARKSKKSKK